MASSGPESSAKGRRVAASSLVLIAAILLTVAMVVSWWGVSISGGGATVSVNFLPGSSYSGSGTYNGITYSASATYTSANLTNVGFLYEAVLALGLFVAIAAFVGMALGYASAFGNFRSWRPAGIAETLTEVSFVFTLILPILIAIMQPWAYGVDTSNAKASCGAGSNLCNSFWGSVSSDGVTGTWGAGVGWYLAVVAAVLLAVAIGLFLTSEPKLYTREEILGASPQPAAPQGYPVGPSSAPYAQSVLQPTVYAQPILAPTPPRSPRFCPFCGTTNAREYSYCQKCGKTLPPPI